MGMGGQFGNSFLELFTVRLSHSAQQCNKIVNSWSNPSSTGTWTRSCGVGWACHRVKVVAAHKQSHSFGFNPTRKKLQEKREEGEKHLKITTTAWRHCLPLKGGLLSCWGDSNYSQKFLRISFLRKEEEKESRETIPGFNTFQSKATQKLCFEKEVEVRFLTPSLVLLFEPSLDLNPDFWTVFRI